MEFDRWSPTCPISGQNTTINGPNAQLLDVPRVPVVPTSSSGFSGLSRAARSISALTTGDWRHTVTCYKICGCGSGLGTQNYCISEIWMGSDYLTRINGCKDM